MARTGVTEHQVHHAADALLRAGERPTIERVRALLGTGSPNTLIRLLDTWWAELGARLTVQEHKLALPDAPPEVVVAASALWTAALAHATALAATYLDRDRAQLEKQRRDVVQSEREMRDQRDLAEDDARRAREAQAVTQTRFTDVERLADQLASQLTDVKEQRATLGSERDDLALRLATAEQRLVDQSEKATVQRHALETQFRTSEDRWLQEVDRSRQEVSRLQARLAKTEQVAQTTVQRSLQDLEAVRTSLRASERALAASESKAATLETEVARLHGWLTATSSPSTVAVQKSGVSRTLSTERRRSATPKPKAQARAVTPRKSRPR